MTSLSANSTKKVLVSHRPGLGICLMILAMILIPMVDSIAKYLSNDISPLLISWARYFAGALIIMPISLISERGRVLPRQGLASQVLRTVFLVTAMTLFFFAISKVPLASALGAYFVSPIFAALLSVWILKEKLHLGQMLAIGVGFIGALIILRPGSDIQIGLIYALGSGFFFACYMVATRKAAQSSPPLVTATFQYILGTILLTPLVWYSWDVVLLENVKWILLMGFISVVSHLLSINAFRFAQASTLSPLIYFELVSASILGVLIFNEFPDFITWTGIVIIVGSGLGLLKRQKRKPD